MGMYTEINVCFDLLKDTSKDIVEILHCLVDGIDAPSILPEHKFFKCDRWNMVACCDSYYFDGSTNSKMVFDDISKTWKINIRANLKNYDSEIEEFLDWLEPYIGTEGFIGYMRYEEWEDPTLIYNDFDNNKIVFKGVEATETVTDRKKHISNFDFDDNRPQCCIDHDKYFSTCDTCEFGGD